MSTEHTTPTDAHDTARAAREETPQAAPGSEISANVPAASLYAALNNPNISGRANRSLRQAAILQLQQSYGNRAVQRLLRNSHSADREAPPPAPGGEIAHPVPLQRQSTPNRQIAVELGVALIPQPTPVSCWAAALTMIVSYRDQTSYTPEKIASAAGMNVSTGYGWADIHKAAAKWGLKTEGPASAMPAGWAQLLQMVGPLWIVEVGAPYHAVVLAGMHGNGSPDDTEVTLYNPWPPKQGAVQFKTFLDFAREFGLGAGAGAQMVHA